MSWDTLHVSVLAAKHLAPLSSGGTSDCFFTLKSTLNSQTFKSKVDSKTLSPRWDVTFNIYTTATQGFLILKLWHKRSVFFKKDEFLGEVQIDVSKYSDGYKHEQWLSVENEPMNKKSEKKTGEVQVRIKFAGPPGTEPPPKKDASAPAATSSAPPAAEAETAPVTATSSSQGKKERSNTADKKKPKKPSKKPISIHEKYDIGKTIGRGAFSVVKIATRKASGKKYAIKCIEKKNLDQKELQLLFREIDIMKKLQHPNVIQLMEVVDTPDTLYLVLEFASGGELFDAIVKKGSFGEPEAVNIIKQIIQAIDYCHEQGVCHRDLKPENLLLAVGSDKKDFVKLADFGLSKDFGMESLQTSCGTPDYVAPEVLSGDTYDKSVDIWSIGVITYVLLVGFPPFWGETQKELFDHILHGSYDFPSPEFDNVSDDAKDFIKKILVVDPDQRMTAEECLEHKWITTFEKRKDFKRVDTFSIAKFKDYTERYKTNQGKK